MMKSSFSTLACPGWNMSQIIAAATEAGYEGIELRFVEGEDSLWKLAAFSPAGIRFTKQALSDEGLSISCVDTSCRFHSSDPAERSRWIAEGERMCGLAAELGAPGIRVFGDAIQPGAVRASTQKWIADSIRALADRTQSQPVEVWLETHGDFATAAQTSEILREVGSSRVAAIWDPVNSFVSQGERPCEGASVLGRAIRHVHLKDVRRIGGEWRYVLTGEGEFPLRELRDALNQHDYNGFLSFEWEKKWHPEIEDAGIALPHFAKWFRENYGHA